MALTSTRKSQAKQIWPTLLLVAGGLIAAVSYFIPYFYITAHPDFTTNLRPFAGIPIFDHMPSYLDVLRQQISWSRTPAWNFWWGNTLGGLTLAIVLFLLLGGTGTRIGKWTFFTFSSALVLFACTAIFNSCFLHIGLSDIRLWPRNGPQHTLAEIHPAKMNRMAEGNDDLE